MQRKTSIVIRAILLNFLILGLLEVAKQVDMTSEWVRKGTLVILHSSCELLTRICMQCTHIVAISTKPNKYCYIWQHGFIYLPKFPTTNPLFLMASGMARIPVPMLLFSMWMMVSVFEILWSFPTFCCCWASESSRPVAPEGALSLSLPSLTKKEISSVYYILYSIFDP